MRLISWTIVGTLMALTAFTVAADASVHIYKDRKGRPIRISSESPAAKPSIYAEILRNSVHGREISQVTVRIVSQKALYRICSGVVGGCYNRSAGALIVPAKTKLAAETVLLHEYGHHLDGYLKGIGPELNGGRFWFKAQKIGLWIKKGKLGYRTGLPWDRKISELWAENYASLHVEEGFCWRTVGCLTTKGRRAMIRDITGRRPKVPKPKAFEYSLDVAKGEYKDISVNVSRTGGELVAKVVPATEIPEDGSTCNIYLLRNGNIIDLASGLGTVTLRRRHAVGGEYVVQVYGNGLGCRGVANITVP